MYRTVQFVEQLQLAGAFLGESGDQYGRLSLILCDNVVELLAHEQCEYQIVRDSRPYIGGKLSAADKRDAAGQKFAPKVNLLVRTGDVTESERDFATRAHTLRNECYHTATAHSDVAWAVAWEYHELACDLFYRLRPWAYVIEGKVPCSDAAKRILAGAGLWGKVLPGVESAMPKLVEALRQTKPERDEPFAKVLSTASGRRFDELEDTAVFLARDGLESDDLDAAIKQAFFLSQVDYARLRDGVDVQTDVGFREFHRRLDAERAAFRSPVRMSDIRRWARAGQALSAAKDRTKALVKYVDLLRESEDAVEVLHTAGRQLDEHIQLQIDIARGK